MTILRVVVVLALVALTPHDASAKWTRLVSPHFEFIGDANEFQIRRVAERLEQFREAMIRALPNAVATSPVPTTVFVFRSKFNFAPYFGLYQGRAVESAGYFLAHGDANYIALSADDLDRALPVVFHEYSHFLVGNTIGRIPPWINEGLAEVYGTFEPRNGGKTALIGLPIEYHVRLLQQVTLMPARDLIAVGRNSSIYNEGIRRGIFYAQSWALTHYLMFGSPARQGQLAQYLARIQSGTAAAAAFTQSFGDDLPALDRELRAYTRTLIFNAMRIDFGEKIGATALDKGVVLDDLEADGYLGDLLARIGRDEQGRALLAKTVNRGPASARAAAALGLLELRTGHLDLALPLLEGAAATLPADGFVQAAYGRALMAQFRALATSDEVAAFAILVRARSVYARAAALSPDGAETLVQYARIEMMAGGDLARARTLLEHAVQLTPSRESYRLVLSDALLRVGEVDRARGYLVPLMERGSRREIRDTARLILAAIGGPAYGGRRRVPDVIDDRVEAGDDPVQPPAGGSGTAPSGLRPAGAGGRFMPTLRQVRTGEERVSGMFTAVDCGAGSIVLQIAAEGRIVRIGAESFDRIDFISYRPQAPVAIACGPLTPLPVLATYRPAPGGALEVVAIELLPDDYIPR